jgi:hypothetical protein
MPYLNFAFNFTKNIFCVQSLGAHQSASDANKLIISSILPRCRYSKDIFIIMIAFLSHRHTILYCFVHFVHFMQYARSFLVTLSLSLSFSVSLTLSFYIVYRNHCIANKKKRKHKDILLEGYFCCDFS